MNRLEMVDDGSLMQSMGGHLHREYFSRDHFVEVRVEGVIELLVLFQVEAAGAKVH